MEKDIRMLGERRCCELLHHFNTARWSGCLEEDGLEEIEEIAQLNAIELLTSQFFGELASEGKDMKQIWKLFSKHVQDNLSIYMSEIA
jgi:hypothetical protein